MTNKPSQGFLYSTTGKTHNQETLRSIESLVKTNGEVAIEIFTDDPELFKKKSSNLHTVRIENPTGDSNDKITSIQSTRFERCIFLDTDTIINADLTHLFGALDKFDIAMAFDPIRIDKHLPEVPEYFATWNSGVVAFRKTANIKLLFERWLYEFQNQEAEPGKTFRDQPPLRQVLYESDISLLTLPDEYNLRVIFPHMVGGNSRVKIFHGRGTSIEEALKIADTTHFFPRVFGFNLSVRDHLSGIFSRFRKKIFGK